MAFYNPSTAPNNYLGTWNAATNSPTLTSSVGPGSPGSYYIVGTAGTTTLDGISDWTVGDWVIWSGSVWQKLEGGATTITVGSTNVAGGTTGRVLYDNGGTLGEYTTTGSPGSVVLSNGPTFNAGSSVSNLYAGAFTGSTTASTIVELANSSSSNTAVARYLTTLSNTANAFVSWGVQYNSGSPFAYVGLGSAVTGGLQLPTTLVGSTSATALAVGANGSTNPALNIDASTASSATGLNIKSAAAAGGVAVKAISSGTDENLTIDAKGAGTISLGSVSTGNVGVGTAVPDTKLTVSNAASGFVAAQAGTIAHFIGDGISTRLNIDAYGSSAAIVQRASAGTLASPSAIVSGSQIGGYSFAAYNSSTFSTPKGLFVCYAAETWTTTANGTDLAWLTTPKGSTTAAERMRADSEGNVTIGTAALNTTATDGFLYIPTCAGAPTGVPTSKTGRVPMVYDSTNNKLYIYNGAWKSATFA